MKYRLGTLIEFTDNGKKVFGKISGVRITGAGTSYEVTMPNMVGSAAIVDEENVEQVYYPQRKSKPRKKKELAHGTES